MNLTKEMLVALGLIMGITVLFGACRCDKGSPGPQDSGVVTTSTPAPTASDAAVDAPPEASAPPTPVIRQVVALEDVEGLWGSKDESEGWADISSKAGTEEDGGKWRYPYPWHLLVHPPGAGATIDCGFHESLMGDAGISDWRVAYCEGGLLGEGRRHAKRLVLNTYEEATDFLIVDIEDVVHVTLDRN